MSKKDDRAKNPFGGQIAWSGPLPDEFLKRLVLSDEQLQLIGRITVHWAQVDCCVTSAISAVLGFVGHEEDVVALESLPVGERLLRLIKNLEEQGDLEPILLARNLLETVKTKKVSRDIIAHGNLGFDQNANASFFLLSRKIWVEATELPDLAKEALDAEVQARELLDTLVRRRTDLNAIPKEWTTRLQVSTFSTAVAFTMKAK